MPAPVVIKQETAGGTKLKYVPVVNYFSREEKASSEIGQAIVDEFQASQKQLAVDFNTQILGLFTHGLKHAHREEKALLAKANVGVLVEKTRSLDKDKRDVQASIAFLQSECDNLNERLRAMNLKFHRCFGVAFDKWDGTQDKALALLQSKDEPLG